MSIHLEIKEFQNIYIIMFIKMDTHIHTIGFIHKSFKCMYNKIFTIYIICIFPENEDIKKKIYDKIHNS